MDLLTLQGCIKRDPDGYLEEFRQQYRHYKACLEIFRLSPSKESREFSDLVGFVAQVASCYPREVHGFPAEISGLLEEQAAALDSATRLALVRALILMRNRGSLSALEVLPTLFRLFRCHDKALRQLLFRHIIADIKGANRKHQDNRLNRGVQAFLYGLLQQDEEATALRALAVLTELHRRNVWRDARTVNVIASATQHPSSRVMLAALKFFLGQDEAEDAGSDDEEEGGSRKGESGMAPPPPAPTSKEVYAAKAKGTTSSKKKKAAKLKRAMQAVKKAERRQSGAVSESFAAMQLLHDPQTFAERLFARLQKANERLETRLAMMAVISRAVGVHRLLLLNFYPFLQKYIQPHQRDVTRILAILIQAVHELVPPDVLAPVLKQLADQFINDRTRPEVMVVGIRTVRELTQRAPLLMTPDLLQDLAEYRKYKHKEVSSAARALVSLFRQINPSLLAKKDRGRGADLGKAPLEYGASAVPDRIEGVELLQAAELAGDGGSDASSDSELELEPGGEEAEDAEEADAAAAAEATEADVQDGDGGESSGWEEAASGEEGDEAAEAAEAGGSDAEGGSGALAGGSDDDAGSVLELSSGHGDGESDDGGDVETDSDGDGERREANGSGGGSLEVGSGNDDEAEAVSGGVVGEAKRRSGRGGKRRAPGGQPDSLKTLKRQLTEAKGAAAAGHAAPEEQPQAGEVPLEWGRILTEEDFERIRELRHKKLVDDTLARHGLKRKQLNQRRQDRLREAAEGEADELLDAQDVAASRVEQRVRSDDLASKHKGRRNKQERLASVLTGREGREFGAAAGRKKQKTGGLSNKQKQKTKAMPAAARAVQLKRRAGGKPRGKAAKKAQRGHTGKSNFGHSAGGKSKKR